ncbi:MAG: hypothetical protein V1750_06545 [Acidobacteriota bacterium]
MADELHRPGDDPDLSRAAPAKKAPYSPPTIAWQESLEEAGVFTACSKQLLGPLQCQSSPESIAS